MNKTLEMYLVEKDMTPGIFAVINMLLRHGPSINIDAMGLQDGVTQAETLGYCINDQGYICLTKKAQKFIETFLLISKSEGLY